VDWQERNLRDGNMASAKCEPKVRIWIRNSQCYPGAETMVRHKVAKSFYIFERPKEV